MPVIDAIRSTGANTLEAMTQALNQRGIRSARGGRWHASSVQIARARKAAAASFYRREIRLVATCKRNSTVAGIERSSLR